MPSPSVCCQVSENAGCLCACECICYMCDMRAPVADVQKLLKGDNFPLITLMRYSADIMSVISSLLGRTTHTLHMLTDCQAHRHALITKNESYQAMKREMRRRGWVRGSEESKKIVSTL